MPTPRSSMPPAGRTSLRLRVSADVQALGSGFGDAIGPTAPRDGARLHRARPSPAGRQADRHRRVGRAEPQSELVRHVLTAHQAEYINQAEYISQGEYLAWLSPRVPAFSQFLFVDDAPNTHYKKGSKAYWSTFQSGLLTYPFDQPKPAYYAFGLPIWLPNPKHGSPVSVWGQIRPPAQRKAVLQFQGARLEQLGQRRHRRRLCARRFLHHHRPAALGRRPADQLVGPGQRRLRQPHRDRQLIARTAARQRPSAVYPVSDTRFLSSRSATGNVIVS